jgi:hypothetical protein
MKFLNSAGEGVALQLTVVGPGIGCSVRRSRTEHPIPEFSTV